MKLTELLDQIDRLDQQATKGPWESRQLPVPVLGHTATLHAENSEGETWTTEFPPEIGSHVHGDDAAFTSLARTALPQLAKALEAVMEIHQKTEHQRAYGFPRADKWEHYCMEDNQSWPCPTVQAITDALGDDDA